MTDPDPKKVVTDAVYVALGDLAAGEEGARTWRDDGNLYIDVGGVVYSVVVGREAHSLADSLADALDALAAVCSEAWTTRPSVRGEMTYDEEKEWHTVMGARILAACLTLYDEDWRRAGRDRSTLREVALVSYARAMVRAWERSDLTPSGVSWETMLLTPAQAVAHGMIAAGVLNCPHGSGWTFCWESGPDSWGIGKSLEGPTWEGTLADGTSFYTEPYWGFDVSWVV